MRCHTARLRPLVRPREPSPAGAALLWAALTLVAPADAHPPTVSDRVAQYGQAVHQRLAPHFERAGVDYPPGAVVLVGIKSKKQLELYAGPTREALRYVRSYPVMGASGGPGPKLREGDQQVPEGIYAVTELNPASQFHLSMRIGYPNRFDRWMARKDGRRDLGGDIYIHGGYFSQGCLAMGDSAAEELFVLAAETGLDNLTVILTPVDMRRGPQMSVPAAAPEWTPWLYDVLKQALRRLAPPAR